MGGEIGLWVKVLKSRYGEVDASKILSVENVGGCKVSSWWRDLSIFGLFKSSTNSFGDGLRRLVRGTKPHFGKTAG